MKKKMVDVLSQRSKVPMLYEFLSSFRFLVVIKNRVDELELSLFETRQWIQKQLVQSGWLTPKGKNAVSFAICCVKRPVYIQLAIKNCNSLHFYNPTHSVFLYMDRICYEEFSKYKHALHYPDQVHPVLFFTKKEAWQLSKVRAMIHASKQDRILVDADEIWRGDLRLSKKKVTFLVTAYPFRQHALERQLIEQIQGKKKWINKIHYVTGFVSIPSTYMSPQLAKKCMTLTQKILTESYTFKATKKEEAYLRRLAEEIGVSLAVQDALSSASVATLKVSDGPSDKQVLQSMYYGCRNGIIS